MIPGENDREKQNEKEREEKQRRRDRLLKVEQSFRFPVKKVLFNVTEFHFEIYLLLVDMAKTCFPNVYKVLRLGVQLVEEHQSCKEIRKI